VDNGLKLSHKLIVIVIVPIVIFSAVFETTFYLISRNKILERYKDQAISLITYASHELENPLYFLGYYVLSKILNRILIFNQYM
jgi:hypothetical protein